MTYFYSTADRFIEDAEILFSDLHTQFRSIFDVKDQIDGPVNIGYINDGVKFEIAVVGVDKKDINIETEKTSDTEGILTIKYTKPEKKDEVIEYVIKKIAERNFTYSWKISNSDLDKISVTMDKGLLTIIVPKAEKSNPKKKIINID